jgi:hypothetical protein
MRRPRGARGTTPSGPGRYRTPRARTTPCSRRSSSSTRRVGPAAARVGSPRGGRRCSCRRRRRVSRRRDTSPRWARAARPTDADARREARRVEHEVPRASLSASSPPSRSPCTCSAVREQIGIRLPAGEQGDLVTAGQRGLECMPRDECRPTDAQQRFAHGPILACRAGVVASEVATAYVDASHANVSMFALGRGMQWQWKAKSAP